MARLIDADELRGYWHISEPCERCHWNNIDCNKPPYYSLLDICDAIDEIPTVDAIPVEWLNSKRLDLQNKDKALSKAAWLVLYEWQKEAEKLGIQPKED